MDKIYKRSVFIEYFLFYYDFIYFITGLTLIPTCINEIVGRKNGTYYSSVAIFNLDIPGPIFLISMLIILVLLTYIPKGRTRFIIDKQRCVYF